MPNIRGRNNNWTSNTGPVLRSHMPVCAAFLENSVQHCMGEKMAVRIIPEREFKDECGMSEKVPTTLCMLYMGPMIDDHFHSITLYSDNVHAPFSTMLRLEFERTV